VESVDELPQQPVDQDRVAQVRAVPATLDGDQRPAGDLGQGLTLGGRGDRVLFADDHDGGAGDPLAARPKAVVVPSEDQAVSIRMRVSGLVSSAQPTAASIGLLECGSVKTRSVNECRRPGSGGRGGPWG
jgi:hypothetical protein